MNKTNAQIKNLVLSAMFIAIGLILPFFTGQIQKIGNMLLPMHLPVMLCGLICGPWYGLAAGVITPLLRSAVFHMPPLFPTAAAMAFELGTYAFVVGFLYGRSKWKCIVSLYRSMIISMLCGRVVWGLVMALFIGIGGETFGKFGISAFLSGAVLNAIPGIIIQLVFIPAIMVILGRTKLISFSKKKDISANEEQVNQ